MLNFKGSSNQTIGLLAALFSLLISSSYPAISRATIASNLPPADLLVLRLGISGFILGPYLWRARYKVEPRVWKACLPLSFLHGWGMAGFILLGLKFAPAAHAGVLGPGTISVWIALIAWVVLKRRPSTSQIYVLLTILLSAAAIIGIHLISINELVPVVYGDALFLLASFSGAGYLFIAGQWKIPALIGVAICAVLSAVVVIPIYIWSGIGTLLARPISELLWHGIYQGIVIGILSYALVNYSINALGSQRAGTLFATAPICASFFGLIILGETQSTATWIWLVIMTSAVFLGTRK
jgi:drug/metabolite transporter (DMT)-like permease